MEAETLVTIAKLIAAGVAVGFGAIGPGVGIGLIGLGGVQGIARNPEARTQILTNMLLMAGFAEAICIYALVIAIVLIFVV